MTVFEVGDMKKKVAELSAMYRRDPMVVGFGWHYGVIEVSVYDVAATVLRDIRKDAYPFGIEIIKVDKDANPTI
tara:strand:+ start:309 stop:530 length:222 start_codon:yes stop_codon:yes gene_type:complete